MVATIYDVAKKAGVSTATVSKVLSGTPYVSKATQARVLAAVEALNYSPNLAARGLSKARTYLIGLVIPYTSDTLFADPHLLDMIRGIDQEAASRGYHILLSTGTEESPTVKQDKQVDRVSLVGSRPLWRSNYVDGAIVVASSVLAQRLADTPPPTNPVVAIGYRSLNEHGVVIHAADREGARAATGHLLALGHRRIGVISAVQPITALSERLIGHQEALRQSGIAFDSALLTMGDFSSESGYQAAGQLLEVTPPITAICAFNDRMAMGAIQHLREREIAVPAEISVIGFDDIPAASLFHPGLTTVRQPALEMGATAARKLCDLIEGQGDDHLEIILPTQLVVRESCGSELPVPAPAGGDDDTFWFSLTSNLL